MKSINSYDQSICVDIFVRPDGSFGYEEYRRDVEDGRGWFPIGCYHAQVFKTQKDALGHASKTIGWLSQQD